MATGSTTAGSQAASSTWKPGGTRKVASSSLGERGPTGVEPGLVSAAKPMAKRLRMTPLTAAIPTCMNTPRSIIPSPSNRTASGGRQPPVDNQQPATSQQQGADAPRSPDE